VNYPLTTCTQGEYDFFKKHSPYLVEKLGDHLIVTDVNDGYMARSIPLVFIFFGTKRQLQFWLRNKDLNPKHIFLATEGRRMQGLRARPYPIYFDEYWAPMGQDERIELSITHHEIWNMEDRAGSLKAVLRFLNPEDEKKWIRLA
jgi:hypothetical protein